MNELQTPPKNYLVESILVTLFCCMPFGVVGLVFAAQVNSKFESGDVTGAIKSSKEAKKWMKWSLYIGLTVILLSLIFSTIVGGISMLNDF